MTLAELHELVAAGEVMAKPDDLEPWATCHLARATWYRQAAAGEFDSFVRRLGRSYRILLLPYLTWLGVAPDADPGKREAATAAHHGRGQCATQEPAA